ncbi:MAG: FmdB family zinc ribbon protein [Bryobacteraceae bacterium]
MPVYEYRCESCGEVFETIQKFVDTPLTVHEKCGGGVQRLISAPALQFKGTGWYVTDYAKSGSGAKAEKSEGNGKKEEPAKKTETSGSTEKKSSSTTAAAPASKSSGSTTK